MRKKLTIEEGVILKPETSSTATKGAISTKTSDENLHVYLDGADRSVVTENQAQTITNKTIDVDNNTLSNVETDNLKAGVLNTSTTLTGATDTQVPSALAVKTFINSAQTDLSNHINNPTDAHDASAISVIPTGNLTSTDTQSALVELQGDIDSLGASRVVGPVSATDNAIARFDSTTGKIIQNSSVTISDVGVVAGMTIDTSTNGITNLDNANFKVNANIEATKIADGSVTNAEFQRLDGVTSPIQTQIDSKVNTTGGSVITPARLDMKQDTLANLTTYALTAANGQLVFATDTKETFVVKDGQLSAVGGGSGGINYNLNPNADTNTNGYATYANTAGVAPITGTGGSPTVTFTRTTSLPLRGAASFLYTKPASNVQGQGYSYDFVIADEDKGKVLSASFAYQIASGTYADNDMSIWIYDITNARMIQGAPYLIKNSGIIEYFATEFQTAINSNSYRIIFHTASTSALAYTVKFDSFNISKQGKLYGSPILDAKPATFTGTWTTNTTYSGFITIKGDRAYFEGLITLSGAPNSAALALTLPAGYVIDTAKIPASNIRSTFGSTRVYDSSAGLALNLGQVQGLTSTTVSLQSQVSSTNTTLGDINQASPVIFANGDSIYFKFDVPIVGWSSSQVMSSDASTRVVAASSDIKLATGTINATFNVMNIPAGTIDTHSAYIPGTGYVVKVPGTYDVSTYTQINYSATPIGSVSYASIFKNGVGVSYGTMYVENASAGGIHTPRASALVDCVAGDIISFRSYSGTISPVFSSSNTGSGFSIKLVQGPSQIMSSETVSALYTGAPPTGTLGATENVVKYGTKVKDSHGAYNPATGEYKVPMSGVYSISASFLIEGTSAGGGIVDTIIIRKGASSLASYFLKLYEVGSLTSSAMSTSVSSVPLLEGDIIKIMSNTSQTSASFASYQGFSNFSITRTGQY